MTTSPIPAYRRFEPPGTLNTRAIFAPELSATETRDLSCNILFLKGEALHLRDWARRDDGHLVPHLCGVPWVMDQKLFGTDLELFIFWMLHIAVDAHRRRVLHRCLYDNAFENLWFCSGRNHSLFRSVTCAKLSLCPGDLFTCFRKRVGVFRARSGCRKSVGTEFLLGVDQELSQFGFAQCFHGLFFSHSSLAARNNRSSHRQLHPRLAEVLLCGDLRYAIEFEENATRTHLKHEVFEVTLTRAHAHFCRFRSDRSIREDADPHLTSLHGRARKYLTSRFDLV